MTLEEMRLVAVQIKYLDWILVVKEDTNGTPYLQWRFMAPDNDNPDQTQLQHARKWRLSYFMVPQEIERTAHKAVRAAVLHEMDENYTYRNVQIHHPHINPDALVDLMLHHGQPLVSRD